VRDLARHQKLQRVLASRIGREVDEPLVDDLGARLCRDVAPKVDVQFTRDFQ